MLEKMQNAWRIPELRKKILYTFGMLLVYRLLSVIPVPGMNLGAVSQYVEQFSILGFMNMMTGGSFSQMTIMAMGITPYINSSIILQLLTVAIPSLEKLAKEGPEGRKKITEWTRYLTVVLAFVQAVGLVFAMRATAKEGFLWYIVIGLSMAAGTALAMWIGERITEKGIGNGTSMLIFASIISRVPEFIVERFRLLFGEAGFSADPVSMNRAYFRELGSRRNFMPHCEQALRLLHAKYRSFIVTNGNTDIQNRRIAASGMAQYFDRVFISEQMGCKKPDRLFYDKVFAAIGEDYRTCSIMIGDSLSSDMQGGRNAGIPTCLYGSHDASDPRCDYAVEDLLELPALLASL